MIIDVILPAVFGPDTFVRTECLQRYRKTHWFWLGNLASKPEDRARISLGGANHERKPRYSGYVWLGDEAPE